MRSLAAEALGCRPQVLVGVFDSAVALVRCELVVLSCLGGAIVQVIAVLQFAPQTGSPGGNKCAEAY